MRLTQPDNISSEHMSSCDKYNFTAEVVSEKRFAREGKVLTEHDGPAGTQRSERRRTDSGKMSREKRDTTHVQV